MFTPDLVAPENDASFDTKFWKQFAVSRNGFLPAEKPLERLPDQYYLPWEESIQDLAAKIQRRTLRRKIDRMVVLSTEYLRTETELRRAHGLLAFLAHAYVWGGDEAVEILPPQLAVPLLCVSNDLELPPVATYAALNLWNFTSSSCSFDDLDSLQTLCSFTDTESESWFFMVSVAMECQGARFIPPLLYAMEAVKTEDLAVITAALQELPGSIRKLGRLLDRMHEKCDPHIFYHEIRPFIAGSKNMAAAGLPNGVFYDEGNGKGEWRQLRGGSNGQSSLVQFLDLVLGVEHSSSGADNTEVSFHDEMLEYMPGPHRRFLEHVSRMGSIRNLALRPAVSPEQVELRAAFKAATRALAEFRNKHLSIVARYIVLPSRQPYHGRRRISAAALAETGARGKGSGELTGTGGTALLPFLKKSRDETLVAGMLNGWENREGKREFGSSQE